VRILDDAGNTRAYWYDDGRVTGASGAAWGSLAAGECRGSTGELYARLDDDGWIRDGAGRGLARVDGEGRIWDAAGKPLGAADSVGQVTDAAGRRVGAISGSACAAAVGPAFPAFCFFFGGFYPRGE